MQLKSVLAVLTATIGLVGPAVASPIAASETRDAVDGYLYVCVDVAWAGLCQNLGFIQNECYNFPAEFQDDISSIGPQQGWECTVYSGYNCGAGTVLYIGYPGNAFLNETGFNDVASSFYCLTSL